MTSFCSSTATATIVALPHVRDGEPRAVTANRFLAKKKAAVDNVAMGGKVVPMIYPFDAINMLMDKEEVVVMKPNDIGRPKDKEVVVMKPNDIGRPKDKEVVVMKPNVIGHPKDKEVDKTAVSITYFYLFICFNSSS
jgi:hypothetical protein